jgi:hypothetical protein
MQQQLSQYYTPQGVSLALNIYNYPSENPSLRVKALRYLLTHYGKIYRPPKLEQLIQRGMELFEEFFRSKNRESMFEVADIINTFSTDPRMRRRCLERIREYDNPPRNVSPPRGRRKPIPKTVYKDTQNVHNSQVNNTVIRASKTLFEKYKEVIRALPSVYYLENIEKSLREKYPSQKEIISDSVEYIKTSTASFYEITMSEVFISVWLWICDQEKFVPELEQRFIDEMKEMKGYCTTGHLARLINVIQGYTEDENLCIRISDIDQCRAVVRQYLSEELKNCRDEKVLEEMIGEDGDKSNYTGFIRKSVSKKLLDWQKEYGKSMLTDIAVVVNEFAGTKVFA